ncbi:hypothetical protein [Flammeovirga aprica]|uniref:Uncharacterized protein n=1 Tax=Flammeovirga aprica JL-4 TaxID=694437 RepID=A0A7X9RQB8_9BACT|nr:hypothetical protein [Flammeovirga aprica]NME66603.1 hypothetical protein [Flammeovirga aprica JL-4]
MKDTDLQLTIEVNPNQKGVLIVGKTNLPEGTKIGTSLEKNGKTIAQNFDVIVDNGMFYAPYGVNEDKVDKVLISCYKNSFWQNESVLKQLDFIQTPMWITDDLSEMFEYSINMQERLERLFKEKVDYPKNHQLIGKIEDIKDNSSQGIKRLSANIIYNNEPSKEDLDNDLKFLSFKIWEENGRNFKALKLKCFVKGTSSVFKSATLAPKGDWGKATSESSISDFELKI